MHITCIAGLHSCSTIKYIYRGSVSLVWLPGVARGEGGRLTCLKVEWPIAVKERLFTSRNLGEMLKLWKKIKELKSSHRLEEAFTAGGQKKSEEIEMLIFHDSV